MIDTVYVDMDGVIVDFDRFVIEDTGVTPVNYTQIYGREAFEQYMIRGTKQKSMFYNMQQMPDAQHGMVIIENLLIAGYNVALLSCTSGHFLGDDVGEMIAQQKREWLRDHGVDTLGIEYIFTSSHDEKSNYASKKSLLIDDSDWSVLPFREKSGHAIKHTSFKQTESEMINLLSANGAFNYGYKQKAV